MSRWTCPSCESARQREVRHPRIARRIRVRTGHTVHIVKLTCVDDVDVQVRDWLVEAGLAAGDGSASQL